MHFLQRSTHFSKTELRSYKRALFRMEEQPWWNVSVARLEIGNGCAHRDRWNPIRTSAIQSIFRPMRFVGFSNHDKGAPRSKPPAPLSSWSLRQTVCITFSKSGLSVVRSASLTKGGSSRRRPSPHLHKVSTQSNKVSPRTFQTALVIFVHFHYSVYLNKYTEKDTFSIKLIHVTRIPVTTA
jgi:hypothetical protein